VSKFHISFILFLLFSGSFAWLSGWSYRKPITIIEWSGNTLTDYQVLIKLNSTNFDFNKANSDGSDIRFADTSDNLLSYWIEDWNSTAQEARIWVKVPSIPANSSVTIYMYYGNKNATDAGNKYVVFDVFLDTNTMKGWSCDSETTWEISGKYIHYKDDSTNIEDCWKNIKSQTPAVIELKAKTVSGSEQITLITYSDREMKNRHAQAGMPAYSDGFAYYAQNNWVTINPIIFDKFYTLKIYIKNTGARYVLKIGKDVYDTDWVIPALNSLNSTLLGIRFGCGSLYSKGEAYIEYIRVRKYTNPEPTIRMEKEEREPKIVETNFPESWKFEVTREGRYSGSLVPCGNFSRWGNWTFVGKNCYLDAKSCGKGAVNISKIFEVHGFESFDPVLENSSMVYFDGRAKSTGCANISLQGLSGD